MDATILTQQFLTKGRSHKCPKILALGILLLEIELDIKIEMKRQSKYLRPDGQPNLNTDYSTAMDLFENEKLWRDRSTLAHHRAVIGYCLKPANFRGCTNTHEEREALYKHVVVPLETTVKTAWPDLDEKTIDPIVVSDKLQITNPKLPEYQQLPRPMKQLQPGGTPKSSLNRCVYFLA